MACNSGLFTDALQSGAGFQSMSFTLTTTTLGTLRPQALASAAAVGETEIAEICFGGACFMFRNDLGLRFDENFVRSQWDDFDFIFQFYELGYKCYIDGRVKFYHHADPKICQDQNYDYFIRKWNKKGLYRGLMYCRYPWGQRGYLPNFGA